MARTFEALFAGLSDPTGKTVSVHVASENEADDEHVPVAVPGSPTLSGLYQNATDYFEASDSSILRDRQIGKDVGEAGATAVFHRIKGSVIAKLGINAKQFETTPRIRRIIQGEGSSRGETARSVRAYVFHLPISISGIRVYDGTRDAGLSMWVHRDGRVEQLGLRGAGLIIPNDDAFGTAPVETGTIRRSVSQGELDRRVEVDFPHSNIIQMGVRYRWPVDGASQMLIPLQAYRISRTTQMADGSTVNSRAIMAYYALDAPDPRPSIFPEPQPDAVGDPRK